VSIAMGVSFEQQIFPITHIIKITLITV